MSPSPGSFSALQQFEHELTRGLRERVASPRQQLWGLFAMLTVATLATVVFGIAPVRGAVLVYLVVVAGAAGVIATVRTLGSFGRLERRQRRSRRDAAGTSLPAFFERAQRRLELASASNAQFEQLRPRLREVAEHRLAGHGTRLETQGARELLGDPTWSLLTTARQGDKFDPGPQPNELRALFDTLERV